MDQDVSSMLVELMGMRQAKRDEAAEASDLLRGKQGQPSGVVLASPDQVDWLADHDEKPTFRLVGGGQDQDEDRHATGPEALVFEGIIQGAMEEFKALSRAGIIRDGRVAREPGEHGCLGYKKRYEVHELIDFLEGEGLAFWLDIANAQTTQETILRGLGLKPRRKVA